MEKCPLSWHPKYGARFGTDNCMRDECAWWTGTECAIITIAKALHEKAVRK